MKSRLRFVVIMLVAIFVVAWCGSRVSAEEHARRRGGDRAHARQQPRGGRERARTDSAQRRHPRPDGSYERNRSQGYRNYDQYHWRNYSRRQQGDRDRFPRYYSGRGMFNGVYYRGSRFGPHFLLRHLNRYAWHSYYWPYAYAPAYGCGWYFVPADRYLAVDPQTGQEYWEYSGYEQINMCFQ